MGYSRDIGNINGPGLIWTVNYRIPEQVWNHSCLLLAFGKIHLRINRINCHLCHVASGFLATDLVAAHLQLCRHLACTPSGIIRVKMINYSLAFQLNRGHWASTIVDAGSVHTSQISSNANWDLFFLSLRKASD